MEFGIHGGPGFNLPQYWRMTALCERLFSSQNPRNEAQRGQAMDPRSQSPCVVALGVNPQMFWARDLVRDTMLWSP